MRNPSTPIAEFLAPRHTPWGQSQEQKHIAPGLIWVSTASHGGYYVSDTRWREIETMFPTFSSYAGHQWLEEDEDWAVAVLVWPSLFSAQEIYNALRTARYCTPPYVTEAWLNEPHGHDAVAVIADAYAATLTGKWEVGALSSPPPGSPPRSWHVLLHREEESQSVLFAEYPRQQFYAEEEIAALRVIATPDQ